MKRLIGFLSSQEGSDQPVKAISSVCSSVPVKSLVKVRFQCKSIDLAYYNDRFDLQKGDVVYVSGKLAGEPGIVTSVTTKEALNNSPSEPHL